MLFNTNILFDYITGNLPEQNIDIYDNPIIAQHSKPSFYESVNENKTIVNPNWIKRSECLLGQGICYS